MENVNKDELQIPIERGWITGYMESYIARRDVEEVAGPVNLESRASVETEDRKVGVSSL